MSNRLNDAERSAIVIIMQRVHEDDVSGAILSLGLDYVHLMVPMEYDWARQTDSAGQPRKTSIGWFDPRWVEGAPEECDRTLAWPERFPAHSIARMKEEIGPYAWCTPGESPILMADLSLKRIDQVNVGDIVVGFKTGNDEKRARLKPAKVLSISKSAQFVMRMTLDSGHIARCTANHRWFTGRGDKTHKPYMPARAGSTVLRVCRQPCLRLPERICIWPGG